MKALFYIFTILLIFTNKTWADCGNFSDEKILSNLVYESLGKIQDKKVFIHITNKDFPVATVKTVFSNQTVKYQNLDCGVREINFDKAYIQDNMVVLKSSGTDRYEAHTFLTTEKFKLNKNNTYTSISRVSIDTYEENTKTFKLALKNKDLKAALQARDFILKINRNSYDPYHALESNIDMCLESFDLGFNTLLNLFKKNRTKEYKNTMSELLGSSERSTDCLSVLDITADTRADMTQTKDKAIKLNPNQIKKLNNYANLSIKIKLHDQALDFLKVIIGADPKNKDAYNSFQEIYKKTNLKTFALMSGHIYDQLNGVKKIFSSKDLKVITKEMKIMCLKDETLKATYNEFLSYPSIKVDCTKGEINRMQFYWNPMKGKVLDFKICPASGATSNSETTNWQEGLLNISSLKNCNDNSRHIQKPDCKWIVACEGGIKESLKPKQEDQTESKVGLLDIVLVDEINDQINILKETSATGFKYKENNKTLTIHEKIFFSDLESAKEDPELGNWSIDCTTHNCVISKYNCSLPYLDINGVGLHYDKDWISGPTLYAALKYNGFNEEFKKEKLVSYGDGYNFYKIDFELMRENQKSCLIKQ